MIQIDLTTGYEKPRGSKVIYFTVYLNAPYYGFVSSSNGMGISFVKTNKNGEVRTDRAGRVRYYFSPHNTLTSAAAATRKRYGIKLPKSGWTKVRVKAYSFDSTETVIKRIKKVI